MQFIRGNISVMQSSKVPKREGPSELPIPVDTRDTLIPILGAFFVLLNKIQLMYGICIFLAIENFKLELETFMHV